MCVRTRVYVCTFFQPYEGTTEAQDKTNHVGHLYMKERCSYEGLEVHDLLGVQWVTCPYLPPHS